MVVYLARYIDCTLASYPINSVRSSYRRTFPFNFFRSIQLRTLFLRGRSSTLLFSITSALFHPSRRVYPRPIPSHLSRVPDPEGRSFFFPFNFKLSTFNLAPNFLRSNGYKKQGGGVQGTTYRAPTTARARERQDGEINSPLERRRAWEPAKGCVTGR
jgi:hypothetical protein